ncbi:hypothetical protein [Povalibacter sp.]|uniref:hypothetical protein n=1 Tax=Povalibacter sp. TaxID=1962978 RepID=UPI002F40F73C
MRHLAAALLICLPLLTNAGSLADLEVYDVNLGRVLPVHEFRGRLYVAGEPGHQYELRIRNRWRQRLLAVTSVDGVNVVSGTTAATDQGGYGVDSWSSVQIDGWRKSLDDVARFYFTSLPDSYAARTGRPDNVGVIGVALFREQLQSRPRTHWLDDSAAKPEAEAPTANGQSAQRSESQDRLGTGHGHRASSPVQYVDFRRASTTPDETLAIYYDSYRNLVAQGVMPRHPRLMKQQPQPFPAGFAPDP